MWLVYGIGKEENGIWVISDIQGIYYVSNLSFRPLLLCVDTGTENWNLPFYFKISSHNLGNWTGKITLNESNMIFFLFLGDNGVQNKGFVQERKSFHHWDMSNHDVYFFIKHGI